MTLPVKPNRKFLSPDFVITDWAALQPFFSDLREREVNSAEAYQKWLAYRSELESCVSEDFAWRYIKMTCNTADETLQKAYQYFVEDIQPHLSSFSDGLNQKTIDLDMQYPLSEPGYSIMMRGIKESVKIFKEENVPLFTEMSLKQAEYQSITGGMSVNIDGEEMTMPQAGSLLLKTDRKLREKAWRASTERRYTDKEKLDANFNELKGLRSQIAINSGFANYRDYMFVAMGRFDYTVQDCIDFHDAIATAVVPIVNKLAQERKEQLGYTQYRPWDSKVDPENKEPLKPFADGVQLLDKTEQCFQSINPTFKNYIHTMRKMGHFDVDSRKGKAPGGYNYPLEETGAPFIFMNSTGTLRDLVTMVHEGGHAIHSFEVRSLGLSAYRNPPMEVAELASMSMELISMEHWDAFFENETDLKRAKKEHLQDVISALPWIATIDKFQHWIYLNPHHTDQERAAKWVEIYDEFADSVTDWTGLEKFKESLWQMQLHIYEVPFYYIEYGMAQLGAISLWKNYKENPAKAIEQYTHALSLGYTKGLKELYAAAGIQFYFSTAYIQQLMDFVSEELEKLN